MTRRTTPERTKEVLPVLEKTPTGIRGLDEITGGGIPRGRPTLVYGSAGSGKTLFGMEFLIRGATEFNEPGVFMSFEETEPELATNVSSLGFDVNSLIKANKLSIDHVVIERSQIEETGEYDLEGLFVRLNSAIDSVKAKRVVLDTIEVLFSGLTDYGIVRAELRRLFRWLKDKGVTAVVTGERGTDTMLTRNGLEEYVSDCVILLDNRVTEEISTRRLRIVKYRGSSHSTNEFPFLIDESGLVVMPVTEVRLNYPVSTERVTTGVKQLDAMLGGKGYIKGTSVLISGMVGTGKTSLAAHFVEAACRAGKNCLYFAYEEAPDQIIRNMSSIGVDLEPWRKKGLLKYHAFRASEQGLEKHLLSMYQAAIAEKPDIIVLDAITDFGSMGSPLEVRQMILRLVDFFKTRGITAMFTSMSTRTGMEETGVGLSSAFDTWIHLNNVNDYLERNRSLVIIKSRGMAHSNQVREFVLTNKGVELVDIYSSPAGAFMGSARLTQMAADKALDEVNREEIEFRERSLEEKRHAMEAQVAALRAQFEAEAREIKLSITREKQRETTQAGSRKSIAAHRMIKTGA
jgi:circadian clock protein KaiC